MMRRRAFLNCVSGAALALTPWTSKVVASTPRARLGRQPNIGPAHGPLRVHPHNSRYFIDDTGQAVYLVGSHTWDNLVDIGPTDPPPRFDYPTYLDFLARHGHNCFRLWTFESVNWSTSPGDVYTVAPLRYARTGPGVALDGKPKFDLTCFDLEYFRRVRDRVMAAGARGMYAAVMLFEGWAMHHAPAAWPAHPFYPGNNINGVSGDPRGLGRGLDIFTLTSREITALQEAYVRQVIDTVNDLDNVLYEISNENHAGSTEWQYHLIRFINDYQKTKPRQHPVGMTFQGAGENESLFHSPADWVSPGLEGGYQDELPAANGSKIVLNDTDHLWGIGGDVSWVWRSFLRGHHLLLMDPYEGRVLASPAGWTAEPIRHAMGHARRLAMRINLAAMSPESGLSSTEYCLADVGREYLVYVPGGKVTIDLSAVSGNLRVEWLSPATAIVRVATSIEGGKSRDFQTPFKGHALLYLHR